MKRSAANSSAQSGGRGLQEHQGCIIDWGDPGSNYGKMADYAIGCKDDGEVAEAVRRAANGDEDGKYIPAKGVALTWARLRELETARGFRDDGPAATSNGHSDDPTATTLSTALSSTISHISTIHSSLPPRTLLIVYSGTGDPRPLRKLGQRKRRYNRLMKDGVRWDDIPEDERWTDDEDQKLKAAVLRARLGVGFIGLSPEKVVQKVMEEQAVEAEKEDAGLDE